LTSPYANKEQLPLCFDSTYTENNQQDTNALQIDNIDVSEVFMVEFSCKTPSTTNNANKEQLPLYICCVGVMYSGELDACVMLL
jgi:hypothetical protein